MFKNIVESKGGQLHIHAHVHLLFATSLRSLCFDLPCLFQQISDKRGHCDIHYLLIRSQKAIDLDLAELEVQIFVGREVSPNMSRRS